MEKESELELEEKATVTLNGQEVTKEEVETLVENQDKNTKIIETGKNQFAQRLHD